jgi:hypothetical protein
VDDEENPRHPTSWQARDRGWFGPSFSRDAPYVIRPNEELSLRYLMVFRAAGADESQAAALEGAVNEIASLVHGTFDENELPSLEEILKQQTGA